jgi:hypothetical protein
MQLLYLSAKTLGLPHLVQVDLLHPTPDVAALTTTKQHAGQTSRLQRMVITTRSQTTRYDAKSTATGVPPSAPRIHSFRSHMISSDRTRAKDAGPGAAFVGSSPIEVLDLTHEDADMPPFSYWVDRIGKGRSGASVKVLSAAGVLTASAKNPTRTTKHGRVEGWDEEESGPWSDSSRDATQAKRQKTDQQNAAMIAQRAERVEKEKEIPDTTLASIPAPIGNSAVAAIMKEAMNKPQVCSNSALAGAKTDSKSTEMESPSHANRTLRMLRTS